MYNEIYKGIYDILFNRGKEGFEYLDDVQDIAKILEINLDFDSLMIYGANMIKMDDIPDILLVLGRTPTGNPKSFYSEYIIYRGKITKVVLINYDALTYASDSDNNIIQYGIIFRVIRECCISVINYYSSIINNVPERSMCLAIVAMYAPSVIFVKIIDTFFKYDSMTDDLKEIHDCNTLLTIYEGNTITSEIYEKYPELHIDKAKTVQSIRKAIDQIKISMLLDNSLWLSAIGPSYPGTRFLDYLLKEDGDDEEDETV